jgi:hypothetical protein
MKLNRDHSLLKRLSDDTIEALEVNRKNSTTIEAFIQLLEEALPTSCVNMDEVNWPIKRAAKDGQETILRTLKGIWKE